MSDLIEAFAAADDGTLEFVKKDADAYLAAQLTVALASNQRAMTFFGFLATAASVIATASITVLVSRPEVLVFGVVGLMTVIGLLVAMVFANLSAMPNAFSYVGNTPAAWLGDLRTGKSRARSKGELLEDSAECIARNKLVLDRAAQLIRIAIWMAWGSIGFGALACLVAVLCMVD